MGVSARPTRTAGRAPASRSRWLAACDACFVLLFVVSAGAVLGRAGGAPPLAWWPALALAALAGVCAADLATGATHWLLDTFFDESTPGIGPALVRAFREHHREPGAIAGRGFLEVTGYNALGVSPLVWSTLPLAPRFGFELAPTLLLAFGLAAAAVAFASNSLHRWAHAREVPRAVRWLQRRGVILSPEAHALHHRGAHDRAYCVATGWVNPVVDGLGLFRALERALRAPVSRRTNA